MTAALARLDAHKLEDEEQAVSALLAAVPLDAGARARVRATAAALVAASRERGESHGTLDAFLHEFALTSDEGVALMCLAESLLRVPDADTADRLIAARLGGVDWAQHLGRSPSPFVNASTWALLLTGRWLTAAPVATDSAANWLARLASRCGEPLVRQALRAAMRIMAEQFVMGRTIESALARAGDDAASFDMLGEAARSDTQAERYHAIYAAAIAAITAHAGSAAPRLPHGVSVKLSALDPRFVPLQRERVMQRLFPKLLALAEQAAAGGLDFTIDAEEADRLELTLALFARLAQAPTLGGWDGLGIAVQAYQKRAPAVCAWLVDLAHVRGRPLKVRLVKGAYWDSEIKHAQVAGLADFPVYTRKCATDVSYLVCAARLLAAGAGISPQFATHNAHTVSAVLELAGPRRDFEFQRLHGMGELLYRIAVQVLGREVPLRIYAPVGNHEDLLPYLVRRLLENGANSSFVNRFLDRDVPLAEVVADPVEALTRAAPRRHPQILPSPALFAPMRANSPGIDLADRAQLAALAEVLAQPPASPPAGPIVGGRVQDPAPALALFAPADHGRRIGAWSPAGPAEIERAARLAAEAQPAWNAAGGAARAQHLRAAADLVVSARDRLLAILVHEAGKTWRDAVDELRETVDFLRYYAAEAERLFGAPLLLPGPVSERNELALMGRGVFACISPWNFPLAIFTGQVAAALAAGNSVLAKPAPQTPLAAHAMTMLLQRAGVPGEVLHLLPGDTEVGRLVVAHPVIAGVAMTGSVAAAAAIQRTLAAKPGALVPLLAETGGQNAMVVDSTAVPEAVCDDVLRSAFQSAGQRCSSLRVLLVQDEIADALLALLGDALASLVVGDPAEPHTDVGPIIDAPARDRLHAHLAQLPATARVVARATLPAHCAAGYFFAPTVVEVTDWSGLGEEVFGPILHVKRFQRSALAAELAALRATGYGLTCGIHSRIESFAREVARAVGAGNVYVNRDMIGAVVGVQPFGGRGRSGTGPKAGGPHYLLRFATEQTISINTAVSGANAALFELPDERGGSD